MATKPLRGRHRARNLALPFVVTAAAACTVKPATESPAPRQSPTPARATVQGEAQAPATNAQQPQEGQDVRVISNPPGPVQPAETIDTPAEKPASPMISNPPPPSTRPVPPTKPVRPTVKTKAPKPKPAAPKNGGKVITQQDGTCIWVQTVKCPPNVACNPPPPKAVRCPEPKGK
tara:strand:- start:61835 stop:62359 length:525 start_codon:yes stop_codon:yes gene_type:complete